jgi:selenoprotein W-related protein
MAEALMVEFKKGFESLTLIPGGGGCFEIKANDELLFSKLKEDRFPEPEEAKELIRSKL